MLTPVRVIKLGGSLLDDPLLGRKLRSWLDAQQRACNVIVVGGGPFVDLVRQADRLHALGDEAAHWLSIRAMSLTTSLVAPLLPEARLIFGTQELDSAVAGTSILDVWNLLQADRGTAEELPHSWGVTSDAIAARVARAVGASELVLLKSALPSAAAGDLESLAQIGYVDSWFPAAVMDGTTVRCVDLRAADFPEVSLNISAAAESTRA